MYYVNSRYYDPETCRFINEDSQLNTADGVLGFNLFTYCGNNPINMSDQSGHWSKLFKKTIDTVQVYLKKLESKLLKIYNSHKTKSNSRPYTGEPGSTYYAPNGDTRTYGSDRKPQHDYDHNDHGNSKNHPHDENGGHHHDWVDGK